MWDIALCPASLSLNSGGNGPCLHLCGRMWRPLSVIGLVPGKHLDFPVEIYIENLLRAGWDPLLGPSVYMPVDEY